MPPVGAVVNRTASACPDSRDPDAVPSIPINRNLSGLETAPTKHGARKCLFIFRTHHSSEIYHKIEIDSYLCGYTYRQVKTVMITSIGVNQ